MNSIPTRSRHSHASRSSAIVILAVALLFVSTAPAGAATKYWYPISTPLPSSFLCGPTSEAPIRVYHQTCLHFSNGSVRTAFILRNWSGLPQYINSADIRVYSYWYPNRSALERTDTCAASWISDLQLRVCYGGYVSRSSLKDYLGYGQLRMNGFVYDADVSPFL